MKIKIGEICTFSKGASIPRIRMHESGDNPYLHYGDLYKGHDLYVDVENPQCAIPFIRNEKLKKEQICNDGDIVYILTSETVEDLGKSLLIINPKHKPVVSGTETTLVKPNKSGFVSSRYLNYIFQTNQFKKKLQQYTTGMKVFRVHPRDLAKIEIELPSLAIQQKIVALLDAIHNLIILNNQINDYLTEILNVQYIDFCATAVGGMGQLNDVVDLVKEPVKAINKPESLPYMPIETIPMKSISVGTFKSNKEAKSSLQHFSKNDIIIGAMRVYFHRVVLSPCEGITRKTCFVLRPKKDILREYALLACFQPAAINYANVRSKGSTMPYAVWENSFETYPILIPKEEELYAFHEQTRPLIDIVRDSYKERQALIDLRDELLPKLMAGEIDVSKINISQLNNHLADY